MLAYPYFIELIDFVFVRHDSGIFEQDRMSLAAPSVHGLLHDFWVISQDTSLEVTSRFCFHSDACAGKVRAADINLFAVKDKHFKPMEQ